MWQALRATRAEHGALLAAAAEKTAKDEALAREAETKAVLEFVVKRVFSAAARPGSRGVGAESDAAQGDRVGPAVCGQRLFGKAADRGPAPGIVRGIIRRLGRPRKSSKAGRGCPRLYARYRGADHRDTLAAVNALANDYEDLGRFQEAVKLHEDNLAMLKATRGPEHFDTIKSMNNLASVITEMARTTRRSSSAKRPGAQQADARSRKRRNARAHAELAKAITSLLAMPKASRFMRRLWRSRRERWSQAPRYAHLDAQSCRGLRGPRAVYRCRQAPGGNVAAAAGGSRARSPFYAHDDG